ncbi:uncharacterized protein LOC143247429 isoform X2 [Tachypleus tridentatus]|uniref:uncharacterized protein LOC143247429 isoform X2 n=1 Tax=Tachypleus tridentatus TaxID=6853 RepID=UPI003FD44F6B
MKSLLNQQMRMHVQLLTQMCLLSKDITGLERYSHIAFSFLEELYTFSQRQLPGDRLSVFKAQNLEESLRIVKCDDSSESKEILEPVSKYKKKNHRFAISDLVKQTLAFSNVFIYPELLPHSGFQCFPEKNKIFFTKAEDHLIALGLEQFLPLTEYPNMHAKLIQIHMLPTKNEQQIRIRIKNAKGSNTTDENPIKYYFKYHVAPPVAQVIKPFDSESVCAPCNLRASQVPKWMVPYLRNRRTIRPHPHVTLSAHCGNDISLSAGITSTTVPKFGYTSRICKTPEKKYVNNFLPRLSMRFSPRTPNKLPVSPLKQISPILKKYGHWSGRNTLCFPGTPVKNPGSSRSCRRTLAPKTDGLSCTILGSTINHNGHISPYVSPSDKNKFSPYSSPVAEYRPIAPKSVQTEKVSVNIHSSPDLQKLHYSNSSFTIPNSKSSDEKCIKNLPFKESNYSVHANSTTSVLPLDSVRTLVHENIEKGQVSQQISWNVETEWPNSVTTKACSEQTDVTFTCSALQNSRVISGDTNQNSLLGNSTCVDSQPSCSASQCNLAVTNLHSEDVPVDLDLGVECDSHIDVEPCDDGEDDGVDDEEDLAALMAASSTICRRNRLIRKKSKQQKELESTLALLAPNLLESDPKKEEKEMVFAQSYLMRVQEALKDEEKTYMKFLQVLCEYENCNNSPLQLYEDVSEILINHQTLVDEFVGFLLPEQARLCGRYDEYLNFSKIRAFLRKLEVHFSKQPQHLHRIVKALTQLQQTSDISSFKVRTTLQPLLRGQSHLVEEFLQLLPGKSPSESLMTDFEEILIPDSDAEETNSDSCEELKIPETEDCYGTKQCPCFCHLQFCDPGFQACKRHCSQCGTKFIDGRIYIQKGKLLKPAYVVYHTAPNSAELGKNLWTQRKNIDSPVSDSQGSESPLSSHCPSPGDCSYSLEETNEYDLQTGKVLNLKPAGSENGMSPGISASETGNEHLPIVQGFCADARTLSLNSNCDSASQDFRNLQSTQDPKNLQSKTSGSTFFVPGTSVSQTSGASDSLLLHIVDHQDVSLSDKPLPNSSNSSLQNISLSGQVFVDTSSSNLQKLSLVDHALIDSSSSNFQKMSPAGQTSLGTFSRNILNVSSSVQTLPHTSSISLQNRSVSGQTSVDALNKKLHYVSPCDHKTLVDISNSKVQNESQHDQKTSLDTSSSSFQNVSLCEQTDDVSRSSPQNVLVYDQISAIDTKSIQQTCENLVTGASSSEQELLVVDRDIKNATRNDQKQVPEQSFDCFTSGHKVISQEEVACIRSSKTETPKQTTQLRLLERSALVSCKKLENIFVSQKEENSMKPDVFKSAVEEHKWTREEDKVLLETCQKLGTSEEAFQQVIKLLTDKTMLQTV